MTREAWEKEVWACRERMIAYLRHNRATREEAEDVFQESVVHSARYIEELRGDCPFSAWFFRVVRQRWIEVVRRKRVVSELSLADWQNHRACQMEDHLTQEYSEEFARRIEQLPATQRAVIEAAIAANGDHVAAARALGITMCAYKGRLHKARARWMEWEKEWSQTQDVA